MVTITAREASFTEIEDLEESLDAIDDDESGNFLYAGVSSVMSSSSSTLLMRIVVLVPCGETRRDPVENVVVFQTLLSLAQN